MNRNDSQKMMTQFHNKYFRQIRTITGKTVVATAPIAQCFGQSKESVIPWLGH